MNNCLIWALAARRRMGGYLVARRSRWGRFPHFLWMPPNRRHIVSYVPLDPRHKKFPPPLFRGRVKWGD